MRILLYKIFEEMRYNWELQSLAILAKFIFGYNKKKSQDFLKENSVFKKDFYMAVKH